MERGKSQPRRCAIYTRKSSEEGLEQDFNSLQAQREACEAFIKSQHGEGWRLVRATYDDGGFSGRTMERPALQRLLADIRERVIDVIVVVLDGFELSLHTSRREFASVYLCPNRPWNPDICEKPPPRKPPKNPLGKPPTGPGTPWGTIDGRGTTLNTGAAEEKVLGT
jgi:resolvase-like protein